MDERRQHSEAPPSGAEPIPPLSALGQLTDDALTGGFRVTQRRRGHRYSLDDTLTAFEAAHLCPDAQRVMDLGCGLGSVLLMLAYKLPRARLVGVEAQAQSFALARHNVARNGVDGRVALVHGDLRDPHLEAQVGRSFDLVTGTPPYQPMGEGTVSPDSQRAHARVELRGGVEAYLQAAAKLVAATGRIVICGDARRPERVMNAASAHGLQVLSERAVYPAAAYKAPLFCVWTLRPQWDGASGGAPGPCGPIEARPTLERRPDFVARLSDGRRSQAQHALRRFFDLPLPPDEAPSPRRRERQASAAVMGGGQS